MIHEKGEHDDNIFATAMALLTAHDFELESKRIEGRYEQPKTEDEADLEWCTGAIVIDEE
jgi:hypothetical protein